LALPVDCTITNFNKLQCMDRIKYIHNQ